MNLMVMSNGNTIMHNIITNSSKFKEENTLGCFLNILVQSGIKRNGRDSESHSPLFLAIDCNKTSETIDTLLNLGCHIDQAEDYPFPSPYTYLRHKYPQIVKKHKLFISLQCLSATVILINKIKYKGIVPEQYPPSFN